MKLIRKHLVVNMAVLWGLNLMWAASILCLPIVANAQESLGSLGGLGGQKQSSAPSLQGGFATQAKSNSALGSSAATSASAAQGIDTVPIKTLPEVTPATRASNLSAAADGTLDRIAAVVNDDIIMESELEMGVRTIKAQGEAKNMSPQQLRRAVLEQLIVERIQYQLADERGIVIDDAMLNKAMENLAKRNGLNLQGFRQALLQEGLDYKEFREQTRRQIMIDALRQRQVDRRIRVTDEEVRDLISSQSEELIKGSQYRLAHIVIAAPTGSSIDDVNTARTRAEDIRKRVLAGEDFNALAKAESDAFAAEKGGDLGWQKAEELPVAFHRSLSLMKIDEVSPVVRDSRGFHILKLLARKGGKQTSVEEFRVRHILLKTDKEGSEELVKERIDELHQRLTAGESFAQLAKANSQDPVSASKGGDLEWVQSVDLVPEFAKIMEKQALNTISKPFRSQFGWHILQVLNKRQQDSTEEVLRNKAHSFLANHKLEEEYNLWLQRLRADAYVEYRLPELEQQQGLRLE